LEKKILNEKWLIINEIIIIGCTALGGPWPPQANVASDFCPEQPSTSFHSH
jgi:hypothetical protein